MDPETASLHEVFVDVLSHELRTPITSIYGGARLLLDDRLAPETRASLLSDIAAEAEQLARLVEDLLAIARLERDAGDRGDEPVLLQHMATAAAEAEERRWPGRQVRVDVTSEVPAVRGDAGLIIQVLRNLIATAMKYSPDNELVVVTLGHDADAAHATVSDRGPGAPAEAGRDAFELFHRSPQVAAQVYGTGISLYVARALIEAQDGSVWLHSRPGGGTEVGFRLPLYGDEAA